MKKPTIEELEDILDGKRSVDIEILPSGEIKEKLRERCKEERKRIVAMLEDRYAELSRMLGEDPSEICCRQYEYAKHEVERYLKHIEQMDKNCTKETHGIKFLSGYKICPECGVDIEQKEGSGGTLEAVKDQE